jgi:hypothetical protein
MSLARAQAHREIYGAPTRATAEAAIDVLADKYGAKYDKAGLPDQGPGTSCSPFYFPAEASNSKTVSRSEYAGLPGRLIKPRHPMAHSRDGTAAAASRPLAMEVTSRSCGVPADDRWRRGNRLVLMAATLAATAARHYLGAMGGWRVTRSPAAPVLHFLFGNRNAWLDTPRTIPARRRP